MKTDKIRTPMAEKKALGDMPVSTGVYSGADVDALLEANRLMEDENIPGNFYTICIRGGKFTIRKVSNDSQSRDAAEPDSEVVMITKHDFDKILMQMRDTLTEMSRFSLLASRELAHRYERLESSYQNLVNTLDNI